MEQLGKYQIVRRLAAGGMAELYLGKQSGLEGFEKTVVIKRLHSSLASRKDLVEMFLNEARIAARLNHPNCVQIYDLGQADGQYFIAMEYIHGPDMMALQRAAKKRKMLLPPPITCYIMAAVCRGLHHAHELRDHTTGAKLNLVHRDVSPHNVLVTYNGDIKLVDFGVAKANTLAAATQAGVLKGKFAYMSPEQCRGDPLDARSDIFAAGILLHELLTRRRLFRRNSDFATMRAVLEEPIPAPSLVAKDLPPAIEDIVRRALARERDERYQDAQQMQLALEGAMRDANWSIGPVEVGAFISDLFPNQDALPAEDSLGSSSTSAGTRSGSPAPKLDPRGGSLLGGLGRDPVAAPQAPLPSLASDIAAEPEPATMIEQSESSEPSDPADAEVVVPASALQSTPPRAIPAPEPVNGPAPAITPEPATALETSPLSSGSARDPAKSAQPQAAPPSAPAPAPPPAPAPAPPPAPAPAPPPAPKAQGGGFAPEGMLGTMLEDDIDGGESTVMTSAPTGLGFDVGDDDDDDVATMMPMTGSSPFAEPQADPLAPEELLGDIDAFDDEDDATVAGPAPVQLRDGTTDLSVDLTEQPSAEPSATDAEPEELATTPLLSPAAANQPSFFDVDDKTPATALDATLRAPEDPASFAQPLGEPPTNPQVGDAQQASDALQVGDALQVDDGTDPVLPALDPRPGDFDDEATRTSLGDGAMAPTPAGGAGLADKATNDLGGYPPQPRPPQPQQPPGIAGRPWSGAAAPPAPTPPATPPAATSPPPATGLPPAAAPAWPTELQPSAQPPAALAPTMAPASPIAPQVTAPTASATPQMAAQVSDGPAVGDPQRNISTQAIIAPDIPEGGRSLMPLIIAGLALLFVGLGVVLVLLLKGGESPSGPTATSIRVTTNPPGARIFLDGKEAVSRTPLVISHPPTGKKLWLVAIKKNYKNAKRKVQVAIGQQLKVDFSLVAESGAKAGRGTLQVRSEPDGADVFVDGTRRGATPLDLKQLTTDQSHVIVVRKDGFKDAVEKVSLEPDKTKTVKLKLEPAPKSKTPAKRKKAAKPSGPIEIPRGRRAGLRDKTETIVPGK